MKIIDLLKNSAEAKPNNIAIKNEHIEISYEKMCSDVHYLAEKLKYAGCSEGVRIAIFLGNSAEYLVSFFAISASGGIIFPLSIRMTPNEIASSLNNADVSIIISDKSYQKNLSNALSRPNFLSILTVQYENGNLKVETIQTHTPKVNKELNDVALFVQTSGTTSQPKIVMLTNDNLISNMLSFRSAMDFQHHNTVYCALPLNHIYCICAQILTHISIADTFIINELPFFIKDFLRMVNLYNVTITAFVPYMAIMLAQYPDSSGNLLSTLKYITLSGAKTPKLIYNILTKRFGTVQFINTYGMSEAGSRISVAAPNPEKFPSDSVGRPIPQVSVKIVDEKEKNVPANSAGEIFINSSGVMKGYYKQPALTANTIIDGWLRTGDIGKLDEKGNLYILARKKDIIISGGENLCPVEIEEHLFSHPAVSEVAVVGQKHNLLQEIPFAFIVKKNPSEKLTTIEIIEYCKNKLSNSKIPKTIKFIEKLPKIGSIKVDRKTLKKMADELCN